MAGQGHGQVQKKIYRFIASKLRKANERIALSD
jgi:hypothetical protein